MPSQDSGNKLAGWSITGPVGSIAVDVSGSSSEIIGTNDLYGQLWVRNVTTEMPGYSGTNFWKQRLTSSVGTQQVVAAIRDMPGNVGIATNAFTISVVTNAAYGYDAAGCVTSMVLNSSAHTNNRVLTWNSRYELTSVKTNGTTAESYIYDALGRRASITVTGQTTHFVYDGPHVIADVDANGNPVRTYTFGPGIDNILAMTMHGATTSAYYYLKDHLGTVAGIVDAGGAIVETYDYDAWGRVSCYNAAGAPQRESPLGNRYTFQGREYSWKTGLYHYRARYYEPVTGRFASRDPIGIIGGLNEYEFVGNDPVNCRDPLGLDREVRFAWGHVWINVDVYDPYGNITGSRDLHFTPRTGTDSDFLDNDPPDTFYKHWIPLVRYETDCEADKQLLELWQSFEQMGKNGPRWSPFYNCYGPIFDFQRFGMPPEPPAFQYVPWGTPSLPPDPLFRY